MSKSESARINAHFAPAGAVELDLVHRMYHRAMDTLQALKNKKCGFEPEK